MQRPKIATLTLSEEKTLFAHIRIRHARVHFAVLFMGLLGLRINEARQIRWGWVQTADDSRWWLHIPEHVTKTRVARTLPIPLPITVELRILQQRQRLAPPLGIPESWPLVLNRAGKPPSSRYIQRVLRDASLSQLQRPIRSHTLRHTFATRLLKYTDIRHVQLFLGHRSITSTQLYTHPTLDDLAGALDRKTTAEIWS
jgi:Site-specific recombinase XerD